MFEFYLTNLSHNTLMLVLSVSFPIKIELTFVFEACLRVDSLLRASERKRLKNVLWSLVEFTLNVGSTTVLSRILYEATDASAVRVELPFPSIRDTLLFIVHNNEYSDIMKSVFSKSQIFIDGRLSVRHTDNVPSSPETSSGIRGCSPTDEVGE